MSGPEHRDERARAFLEVLKAVEGLPPRERMTAIGDLVKEVLKLKDGVEVLRQMRSMIGDGDLAKELDLAMVSAAVKVCSSPASGKAAGGQEAKAEGSVERIVLRCPLCGSRLLPKFRYCPKCGARLPWQRK